MSWDLPVAGTGSGSDALTKLKTSLIGAATRHYGATDPSSGSWGAAELGQYWIRTSAPYSDDNPAMFRWELKDATPTYGWVLQGVLGWRKHGTPANRGVTFTTTSPQTANVAWEDVAFAAQLDTERTAQGLPLARVAYAVKLVVRVEAADTIPTGAGNEDKGYFALRENGDTGSGRRFHAQVADRAIEYETIVFLDGSEKAEMEVKVEDGASPSFKYEAWVMAWMELL